MSFGEVLAVKVVAVEGGCGDWAAYVGPEEWTVARVQRQGMKVQEVTAEDLFGRMVDQGGERFCRLVWRS